MMKKIMTLLVAVLMVFSLTSKVDAADTYTITIENGVDGQTYKAYKIFDVTLVDTDGDNKYDGYAYTISTSNPWFNDITGYTSGDYAASYVPTATGPKGLTLTKSIGDATKYVVTFDDGVFIAKDFAEFLASKVSGKTVAGTITEYSDSNKIISVNDLGYYFVDSSMGSLCSLDTTDTDVTIYEKNTTPSITKKVEENDTTITIGTGDAAVSSTANEYGKIASYSIGDTINFQLTVNTGTNEAYVTPATDDATASGNGVSSNYVITDVLPAGLTFGEITSVKAGDSTWAVTTNYTVDTEDQTVTINLLKASVAELGQNKDIVITYTATLNENAVIAGTGNTNTATLTYTGDSVDYTDSDTATVYTYAGALLKYNATKVLDGATFTFPFTATKVSDGSATEPIVYRVTNAASGTTDITTPKSGAIVILGLDKGEYSISEKEAPQGYNALTAAVTLKVDETEAALTENVTFSDTTAVFKKGETDTYGSTTVMIANTSVLGVLNQTGTELPSTGGIGTTVFHIVGAVLILSAGIILVSKKRVND